MIFKLFQELRRIYSKVNTEPFLISAPRSNILSIPLKIMMFLSGWKSNFGLMWTENLSRNLILKIEATQIMKLMILTGDHDNMI